MERLTLSPRAVRFPDRCTRCGASPSHHITVDTYHGIDLLVIAWGRYCEIEAPACVRCKGRRLWGRIGWFTGIIGLLVAFIGAVAVGFHDTPAVPAVLLTVVLLPAIWFLRRREGDLYNRLYAPFHIARWDEQADTVELAFKDATLAHDVAVLSGLRAPASAPLAGYREAAATAPPPAWSGPRPRTMPWWAPVLVGLGIIGAGFAEYSQFAKAELYGRSVRDHAMIILLYKIGGKFTVLAFFALIGAGLVVLGIAMRLRAGKNTAPSDINRSGTG
jgi:hypothetical protein